jgi:RNA polymerase sigma-70 factor, ECF subfamily
MLAIRQGWVIGALAERELHSRGDERAGSVSAPGADEAALLRAGRAGDGAALDQLLALHERPLLALCAGILGQPEDAEDAVQETFLRALRALAAFREQSAFRTWLYRIALNVCLNRKSERPFAVTLDEEHGSPAPDALSPEAMALRQLRIQEALASLLPRQRAILLLKERDAWSVSEIAVALNASERQVRFELSKARLALARWRQQQADEGGE